jgi:threonine 3-dehydrogenase
VTTALVIGAGGQIGSDLVPALAALGHQTHMLDLRPPEETPAGEHLAEALADDPDWRSRWITADAASPALAEAIARIEPDVVFHLAAMLSATGEAHPDRCWHVNMNSLQVALDALDAQEGRPVLAWPSSIAAFGPMPDGPAFGHAPKVPNEFPLLPRTMYGVTKVAGELLGSWYADRRAVDFRSLRFPGLLSATEPGGGSSDYANEMYFAAARGEPTVSVFVKREAALPFMHMSDAVSALMGLASADEQTLTRRVYNVSAFAPTAAEIEASIKRAGVPLAVAYMPDHRQAFVDSWPDDVDDGPARKDWGFSPALDLDGTTARLLEEIRALCKA